jgi:hypothetical protein
MLTKLLTKLLTRLLTRAGNFNQARAFIPAA